MEVNAGFIRYFDPHEILTPGVKVSQPFDILTPCCKLNKRKALIYHKEKVEKKKHRQGGGGGVKISQKGVKLLQQRVN